MIDLLQRRRVSNRYKIGPVVLIVCFLLFLVSPPIAGASNTEWDSALTSIDQLHDNLSALELTNKQEKLQIQALRKQNNEKLKEVNIQVRLIDKVKLDRLKMESDKSQKKFAPLFADYTDIGKKATEARKRKDLKSVLLFELKRNRMKASVLAARQEIKLKKDALTTAKKHASEKTKIVKDILVPVQTLKKQITTESKKIIEFNKQRIAADKRYKAAVKQGDAAMTAVELRSIVGVLSQIHESQNKINEWETIIRSAINAAEAKLPK